MLQSKPEHCPECGEIFDWADTSANNALRQGNFTKGFCRECRSLFWAKLDKKNLEN